MPREQKLSNTFETDLQGFSPKRSAKHGWSREAGQMSPRRSRQFNVTLYKEDSLLVLRRDGKQVVKSEREMERRVASPVVRASTAD